MKSEDRNREKEPFKPEETPEPAQVKDPNIRNERNEPSAPVEGKKRPENKETQIQDTGKRLGDETEITDETTI